MIPTHRTATHPGALLLSEFLEPLGISQKQLAAHIGLTPAHVNEIVKGSRGITARTAWLLAQAFETTPAFWLNAQMVYELSLEQPIKKIEPIAAGPVVLSDTAEVRRAIASVQDRPPPAAKPLEHTLRKLSPSARTRVESRVSKQLRRQ